MPALPPFLLLDRELGSGTTGSVRLGRLREAFAGLDAGARVALKIQHPGLAAEPGATQRFARELAAGSAVDHPSLVRVLAHGESELGRWLLLRYVAGVDLRRLLQARGALAFEELRRIGVDMASALAALHHAGWRHGDLKPENVLVDDEGRAVLIDLGFATPLDGGAAAGAPSLPEQEARSGSLAYLSPEQARGGSAGAASDLFALGVVLYELATAVHPSVGRELARTDAQTALRAIAHARPVLPSLHAARLPAWFDRWVVELLSPDPGARPAAADTESVLREGSASRAWRRRRGASGAARHTRSEAQPGGSTRSLPFVGREAELARLTETWSATLRDGGRALSVVGETGSGRSRLLFELAARLRAGKDAPVFLHARASEGPEAREAETIVNLIRRWLALPPDRAPSARHVDELSALLPPARAQELARVLDPRRTDPPGMQLAPLLAEALARMAASAPLLVFVDDLEWCSRASIEALTRLLEGIDRRPLMLVLGRRPEVTPSQPAALARLDERAAGAVIELSPLSAEDVMRLIERLFEQRAPRVRLARVLHERSSGFPGLLSEILAVGLEGGLVAPAEGDEERLSLRATPEDLPWPSSLGQAVAERYRSLSPYDRAWLRRLAVVGGHLEPEFLARAFAEGARPRVDSVLARLVDRGWLSRQGERYRFARPILRQAVYDAIPRARRAELHARAAAALAPEDGAGIGPARAWQRAFHLRQAGRHAQLLRLVGGLVRSRWGRTHPGRVHTLASWGLESIDHLAADPGQRPSERLVVALLLAAADAADRLGWREEQRRWLDRLREHELDPQQDPRAAGRLYLLHGRLAASTGELGLARGLVLNACRLFARAGDSRSESEATRRLAHLQAGTGDLDSAGSLAQRALDLAGGPRQAALALITVAGVELLTDRLEAALGSIERALAELRELDPARARGPFAFAYLLRGRALRLLGRPWFALAALTRALRLSRAAGERRLEVECLARTGQLLLEAERVDAAEDRLREAILLAREIEDRRGEALAALFLGVLLAEGDRVEAGQSFERALLLARGSGLKRVESLALAMIARWRLVAGELQAALESISASVELLERFGAELADRIVIKGTHALLLTRLDEGARARALARELGDRVRRESAQLEQPLLRQRQRRALSRLLAASLTADGPLYPRANLRRLPT